MSDTSKNDLWPAEFLAEELRQLNREHLRFHHNPMLKGRESWPNQQPESFAEELSLVRNLGVVPVSPGQLEFDQLLAGDQRFNWAVLLDGSLRISPSVVISDDGPTRISHAVLCYNGGDVLAAGEGRAGDYLSNTTGHYKNEEFVIVPVRRAFEKIGVFFRQ